MSRRSPDSSLCCWTSLRMLSIGAGGLRAAQQEQVLAVARDPLERRAQARVVGQLGGALALGQPRAQDLLADVLDLDRAGLVRQVGERRLHGDEPVEQVLLVVLEADVEDVGLTARGDVARHLEGHRRLAGALRAADEQQLAGPQAATDGLVQRREAERHRLVLADLPVVTFSLRSTSTSSAERGAMLPFGVVEAPGRLRRRGRRPVAFGCLGGQRVVVLLGRSPVSAR